MSCKIKNDYNCGNYTLMYKIGDDKYTEYTGNITVTEKTTISAKIEEIETSENSIDVEKIDNTPPIITINNQSENKWTKEDVKLELTAEENESGIKNWQYSSDGKTWKAYKNSSTTEFNYTYKEDINETVYIRACDNVGNCSEVKSTNIKIDKTAPIISIDNSSNGEWTNKDIILKLTAEETSGIKNWQYSYDNKKWYIYSNSNTDIYETEYKNVMNKVLYIKACDNLDNCSEPQNTNIKIETTAPTISITNSSNGAWTNKDVTLTLSATEKDSGINYWEYSYDENNWIKYDDSSSLKIEKIYQEEINKTFYIRTCDNAGNCSKIKNTNIKIDKTAPNTPTTKLSNYNIFEYNSIDNGSGIKGYYVSQNSAKKGSITTKTSKTASSVGMYYIWAVDNAGNVSETGTINAYKLILTAGTGTTLKALKDSTSIANKSIILEGTNLSVSGALKAGYHDLIIKYNDSEIKNNYIINVTGNVTLISSSTPYTVTITYSDTEGTLTSTTKNGDKIYNWSKDSENRILLNNSLLKQTINYGEKLGDNGLVNYDNKNYLKITREDYVAKNGAEWKCISDNCKEKTYSDSESYSSSKFCDASNGSCEVVLSVNWVKPSSGGGGGSSCSYCDNGIKYVGQWQWYYDDDGNLKKKCANASAYGKCSSSTSSKNSTGGTCFVAGTRVLTANGYKNIEDIRIGDAVLSYNEVTNKNEYKFVKNTVKYENAENYLYTIYVNDKVLNVTSTHKFYVYRDNSYKLLPSKDLKIGDKLILSNSELKEIYNITYRKFDGTVYNFEVSDNHNYYVDGILVHNVRIDFVYNVK